MRLVLAVLAPLAALVTGCGTDPGAERGVPWTLAGTARDGRELRLRYEPFTACDPPARAVLVEKPTAVEIAVLVEPSTEACILIVPRPATLTVELGAPLGGRRLLHARGGHVPLGG